MALSPRDHVLRPTFDQELQHLRDDVLHMGELVDGAIALVALALAERDVVAAQGVIVGDAAVNALHRDVRDVTFSTLLTQGPVACDLREVIALQHMAAELERIGDHCVSIAKQARTLADLPPLQPSVDVGTLAAYAAEQVRDILAAVVARDARRAREVAVRDDRIDRVHHRILDQLVERMTERPQCVPAALALVSVTHHLERIGDRVTNLAEDVVFVETGEIVDLG